MEEPDTITTNQPPTLSSILDDTETDEAMHWASAWCFILIVGIVCLFIAFVAFTTEFPGDDDADDSSNGPIISENISRQTKVPLSEAITAPDARGTSIGLGPTGTTSTIRTPPPLLCSVDHQATTIDVYPADWACDILIYTHVRIENREVVPVLDQASYKAFGNVCGTYPKTSCGLSFDSRHTTEDSFDTAVLQRLRNLPFVMNHFAMMNIHGTKYVVSNYVATIVPGVVRKIRSIFGRHSQSRKIIIGFGYFHYAEPDSWNSLQNAVTSAMDYFDIAVIITSVVSAPGWRDCTSLPNNALESPSPYPPTLMRALPMALSSFARADKTVAFAFQMGVAVFSMNDNYTTAYDAVYKPCSDLLINDVWQWCDPITKVLGVLGKEDSFVSIAQVSGRTHFISLDTANTLINKAEIITYNPSVRKHFTWFLFNAHLTDQTSCIESSRFRLREFREFFNEQILARGYGSRSPQPAQYQRMPQYSRHRVIR